MRKFTAQCWWIRNLIPLAVSRVWHSDPDIQLLDQILPDTAEAYSQALAFLVDEQDPTAALEVWNQLVAINPAHGCEIGLCADRHAGGAGKIR